MFKPPIDDQRTKVVVWQPEVVDCSLQVKGNYLYLDHNYELFSALCRQYIRLHDQSVKIGIAGINGIPNRRQPTRLQLTEQSKLRLRLPIQHLGMAYRLEMDDRIVNWYSITAKH
jgi:CRISPR-associated protein Cas6